MRTSYRAIGRDRVSGSAIIVAGLLCGASVFFVALPLANSSPFPTPRDGSWVADREPAPPQRTYQVAAASSYQLASLPARLVPAPKAIPDNIGAQAAIEWEAMTASSGMLALAPIEAAREEVDVTGSLPASAAPAEATTVVAKVAATAYAEPSEPPPAVKRALTPQEEVDEYLWEVYQRSPIKKDGSGDFTWKDPAAAKRVKMSIKDYVIGGMNKDFREQLYHAGRAMDAAGVRWALLSAFRDDYRQSLASGFKAGASNSLHGGKARVGGYGHGQAVDVTSEDGHSDDAVWRWFDRYGAKYGLRRPMPGADPAHVQPGGNWHRTAIALRDTRVGTMVAETKTEARTKVVKASW